MRNLKSVVFISVLMLALSSQAFAYFDTGHLYQTIVCQMTRVNPDTQQVETVQTKERSVDLGSVTDIIGMSNQLITTGHGLTTSTFDSSLYHATWGELFASYYTDTEIPDVSGQVGPRWFAGSSKTSNPVFSGTNNFDSGWALVKAAYSGSGTAVVTKDMTASGSYAINMDKLTGGILTSQGTYDGFVGTNKGDAVLTALGGVGYVDMYLMNAGLNTANGKGVLVKQPGQTRNYWAVLRLYTNGDVLVNPVPIPASFLLFGTGLLGLFGLKRKNAEV